MNRWLSKKTGIIEKVLRKQREMPYANKSKRTLNSHLDAILKMGPKHILEDNINQKETIPRAESIIEMLTEKDKELELNIKRN